MNIKSKVKMFGVVLLLAAGAGVVAPVKAQGRIDRDFLSRLLEIPSVTADLEQVNRAVDFVRGDLEGAGIACIEERDAQGRKILYASTRPGKVQDYLLVVHLDVVPAESGQFKAHIEGDRIFARGAHDCKGNAVLAVQLLKDLNGTASVGAVFASDEELGGPTTGLMVSRGYLARKLVIVVDSGTYGVYYAQKGNCYIRVRAAGRGGHSSLPMVLDNPIDKLVDGWARFKAAWPKASADGWCDIISATRLEAGEADNRIPDTADMMVNLRSVNADASERAIRMLREVGGFEIVNVRSTGLPMTSDRNEPEVKRLLAARQAMWPERKPEFQRMMAITDARHFATSGVPTVIIGSMGGNAHGKDEWADLKSIDENLEMLERFCSDENGGLIGEIGRADRADDAAVAAIGSAAELKAKQFEWRTAWLAGIGGLPETKTPLNAKTGPVVTCDGFTLQNVLFESQPGVYVTGHLFLPDAAKFAPPYPCVMMPMGHSDAGILNLRYATHAAMTARAGLAVFSWDPISQGERRQSRPEYDYTDNCSTEHSRLGARGWLVGWNFARFRIWDAIRAVDYVLTRKEIDGSRLGVMGTSGGGTMSAYMQALDDRITIAFPNCFVSSIRAIFGDRGCHDAEQFFFNQLNVGVNHAAILALGQPRVALATGSRWRDYFPHEGAVDTFAVYSNLVSRLAFSTSQPSQLSLWHFSCDGPHGLPASTRAAQTDWMRHHLIGAEAPRSLAEYWALDPGPEKEDDPSNVTGYPFDTNDTFFTSTHQVRDLPGFKSVYSLIADRALELKAKRTPKTRTELREIVRRRAGMRALKDIRRETEDGEDFKTDFNWWYLTGSYGVKVENKAAILSTLGRSYVGEQAEGIIRKAAADVAANGGKPVVLRAKGWDCIAAAHAYAAEPQLFSRVEFTERPPSWTEMVVNPDTADDSFAVGVWGALLDYDWVDLVK